MVALRSAVQPSAPSVAPEGPRGAALAASASLPSSTRLPLPTALEVVTSAAPEPQPARWPGAAPSEGESEQLMALLAETFVRAAPNPKARKLGYLRAGARVRRAQQAVGTDGCPGGWYPIAPEGFVCVGKGATLDLEHPLKWLSTRGPERSAPLPYRYGKAVGRAPVQYVRLPDMEQQRREEPELGARARLATDWPLARHGEIPPLLASGAALPNAFGVTPSASVLSVGRAMTGTTFAFVELFDAAGRSFGVTADSRVVALDQVTPVKGSEFHGVVVEDGADGVAFAVTSAVTLYTLEEGQSARFSERLPRRTGLLLSGERKRVGSAEFLRLVDGRWVAEQGLLVMPARKTPPSSVRATATWIDVSLGKQVLGAYEGERLRYATLVSTGVGGAGDPTETHATVQGLFRIHTKHVSVTMDADDVEDPFDLRDVPWVQYFQDGYALHAAWWHDGFGTPRSHGCINQIGRAHV